MDQRLGIVPVCFSSAYIINYCFVLFLFFSGANHHTDLMLINFSLFKIFFSLDGLVMRFEAPESRNRWDSPLFTILPEDELPFEAICDAIFHRKAPPPNMSTVSVC